MRQWKGRCPLSETKSSIPLRSEEVQDILSAAPAWMILWGSSIIFMIILGVLFMSWLVKYPDSVTGQATFTTAKEPVYLYAIGSGNISNLYVEEGEMVQGGQLLAEINSPVQKTQIDYLRNKLKEIDLFLNGEKSIVMVSEAEEPSFGEIQANYNRLKENINDFMKLRSPYYQSSISQMKDNIDKYRQLAGIYNQKLSIAQRELTNAELKFQIDQQLYEEKVISSLQLIDKESTVNQRRMEVQDLKQALVQNQLDLSEMVKKLQEQLFSQEESARKLKGNILSEKKIVENFTQSWKQSYTISTPSAGKAIFIEKFSTGYYVKSDKPLIAIIPENEEIIAKVKVSSSRYGKIKEGQKVRFELDNYPFQEHGYLYGFVKRKGFIPIDKTYELIIELPDKLVSNYGYAMEYKPNMVGNAEIIIEEQRVLEKLFYSFRKLAKY